MTTANICSRSILCCNCGAPTNGQTGALCYDCVKLTVDLSRDIQREAVIHFCRDCDRWLLPPASWIVAAPESRELLALCLKKLRGLGKVRLVDASFIWTEPHSRRIKVKLTVQDSIPDVSEILVQQSFEITYMVHTQQCPECAKSFTANVWRACVQVRQKVLHKRTFLFLEQLILKHNAHRDTINIKEVKDGIDFFFAYVCVVLMPVLNISSVTNSSTARETRPRPLSTSSSPSFRSRSRAPRPSFQKISTLQRNPTSSTTRRRLSPSARMTWLLSPSSSPRRLATSPLCKYRMPTWT